MYYILIIFSDFNTNIMIIFPKRYSASIFRIFLPCTFSFRSLGVSEDKGLLTNIILRSYTKAKYGLAQTILFAISNRIDLLIIPLNKNKTEGITDSASALNMFALLKANYPNCTIQHY